MENKCIRDNCIREAYKYIIYLGDGESIFEDFKK